MKWLVSLFFIAHGLVHAAVWLPPYSRGAPFNPSRSWLFGIFGAGEGPMRILAIILALVAATGFMLGGVGWLTSQGWGRSLQHIGLWDHRAATGWRDRQVA